jgi:hypothetical protein
MNRRNPEKGVLKVTLLLASTFTVMAWTMIAPALPSIQAHFAEVANVAFWVRLVLTLPALFIARPSQDTSLIGSVARRYS